MAPTSFADDTKIKKVKKARGIGCGRRASNLVPAASLRGSKHVASIKRAAVAKGTLTMLTTT